MSQPSTKVAVTSASPDTPDALLARVRKLRAQDRLPAISRALHTIQATPTTETVFLRKALLRMRDATRLETGDVTQAELHRENSPFARMDFRRARLNFRPRVHV